MQVGDLVRHKFFETRDGLGIILETKMGSKNMKFYQVKWLLGNQSVHPQWFPENEIILISEKA